MIVMMMREREVWVGRELFGGPLFWSNPPTPRMEEDEKEREQIKIVEVTKARERERAYRS